MSGKRPPPGDLRTGIVLEDVTFCYPGAERPALQNVSLELPAGSVVALVGENGAGKSSVAKLLCRLYDPQAGRILIDDVELRQLDVDRWRERITGAFQDFASYQARIGESVGLGKLDRIHDAPAIEDALGRAGGLEFALALPEKLDTQLGTAYAPGVDLSGGQWQKVALARGSMPRRPLLVLLDEPTSALDAAAEHALYERYAESARHARQAHGAVTVIISHRFSTVRMADVIVVLSKGRVLEVGSHDDLQAAGGLYAELFALQKRAYGRA
jgi:ATP-binding cassette subfamily B protein